MALESELMGLNGTICDGCGAELLLGVCRSAAGWYLGYFCGNCGPYSRETGYFTSAQEAADALAAWLADCEVPENVRTVG